MNVFLIILFVALIACAVEVSFTRNLLKSVLVFMGFSLVMSIVWVVLESPDLAITEAAVGAGVTTVLFLATLKKIKALEDDTEIDDSASLEENIDIEDGFRVSSSEGGESHEL